MRNTQSLLNSLRDVFFLEEGDVELNGRYGAFDEIPLHIFATRGDLISCKELLEAGSEVNVKGEHGFTPLHEAVQQGHVEVVKPIA